MLTSSLLSCDKSQSSLVDQTPWDKIYDKWVSFGGSVFRQVRIQRKPLTVYLLFPSAHSTKQSKWHILGWHVPNSNNHVLGKHILLPFNFHYCSCLVIFYLLCVSPGGSVIFKYIESVLVIFIFHFDYHLWAWGH